MAPGGATSTRGRGGKFKKYTRGGNTGGHHFSRDLQPIDDDGNAVSMWAEEGRDHDGSSDSEEDGEEDSEEEESGDGGKEAVAAAQAAAQEAATREDRKAQKKARKEAALARQKAKDVQVGDLPTSDEDESDEDDDEAAGGPGLPANPNHSRAAREQAAKAAAPRNEDGDGDDDPGEGDSGVQGLTKGVKDLSTLSRREREAVEAAASRERYLRLQAQGKTDEAKADLARLKVIREQRAAEAARRQVEKEEKDEADKTRRAELEAALNKKRQPAAGKKGSKKK
ncbi:Casein kinase substrate phosphoprotein PP28 [Geosmithia morbida]|uniref:Casein kinase substrate phosphoprotein PP28 n=1 Tax=Geosmithia morbida TaxID=1094350 RepID=A0A9P4YTK1_9HYPO|nr:Casein kinase substrate phosphoprotein PP28 [Geosmithia morbida]KAF4121524.1 Casein kinase substrate phosphoprotein PP28 [Geosmithia morbida]